MRRTMLKSKIHRATLTGTEPHYEGSVTVDQDLLDAADILPGEQVQVLNLNNGARLITYAISAPRGSGTMLLNALHDPTDTGAWTEFNRRYKPLILLVAKRLGLRDSDAEDVCQETMIAFIEAYRKKMYDRETSRKP